MTSSIHASPPFVHRNTCKTHQSWLEPQDRKLHLVYGFLCEQKKINQGNTQFCLNIMVWIVVKRLSLSHLWEEWVVLLVFWHSNINASWGLKNISCSNKYLMGWFNGCSLNLALAGRSSACFEEIGLGTIYLSPSRMPFLLWTPCKSEPAYKEHNLQKRFHSPGEENWRKYSLSSFYPEMFRLLIKLSTAVMVCVI